MYTVNCRWLEWAKKLQHDMDTAFAVPQESGYGYYSTRADSTDILLRLKAEQDGAEPSPASVAGNILWNFLQIFSETHTSKYLYRVHTVAVWCML
jgi:uncharacterized protein YyaL (SSP411 family)